MKPILVHCHIYYTEMWPELKQCIQNIAPYPFDLYVTMVERNYTLLENIIRFKPDAHIDLVPNKGFDIAPFIDVLNKVNLNDYDYIIKLHTKRDMPKGTLVNGWNLSVNKWRKACFAFLKSSKNFKTCLKAFEEDKKLGMIGDFHLISNKDKASKTSVNLAIEKLKNLNFIPKEYCYVMGTMFIGRANLFEPLHRLNLSLNDFSSSERGKDELPYALERLFGYLIGAQGYKIKDPIHNLLYKISASIGAKISNFIWRKKECSNGYISFKFCKIPIYKTKRCM